MRKILRGGALFAALLTGLITLYTALMLAAYSFPDAWVEKNVKAAVAILDEEGNMPGGYATYFWHDGSGITDNITDKAIYGGLLKGERSTAQAAMRIDYMRYWHGYAVVLRPLLTVLSILNIRYLNMLLLTVLMLLCVWRLRERCGAATSVCFVLALVMSFILIAPFCQQYMSVTALALLGCCVVLQFWHKVRDSLPAVFFALGSLVCFFDFLTFPVLALGYPLICCQLLRLGDGKPAGALWGETIALSAAWLAGYALTWLSKGLIGTLLTGENMLCDIVSQVLYRTGSAMDKGSGMSEITPMVAIGINTETFFTGSNVAMFVLLLISAGSRALWRRAPAKEWARALPVAAVALYPFAWYVALKNHVRLHFWMTYKQLSVTVFALCAALLWVGRQGKAVRPIKE